MSKKFFAAFLVLSLLASVPNLSASSDEKTSIVTQVTDGVTSAAKTTWDWTGQWAWDSANLHPYWAGSAAGLLVLVNYADDLGIELPEWLEKLCPCITKKAKA